MNLLAKKHWGLIIILLVPFLLFSCEDDSDSISIGENRGNFQVSFAEIKIPSSVVKFDSIGTTRPSRYIVGAYTDPLFGKIKAVPSFSGRLPFQPNFDASAVYDSLVLVMDVTSFYGEKDNVFDEVVRVRQLTDTLELFRNYYSFDQVPTEDEDLNFAENGFLWRPTRDTSRVTIRLKDTFGQAFFDLATAENAPEFANNTAFNQYFKGVSMIPGDDNETIMRFDPSSPNTGLILYYTEDVEGGTEQREYRISLNEVVSFNSITADRTGTEIEGLDNKVPFVPADDMLYSQAGTGEVIQLDFSEFRKIKTDDTPVLSGLFNAKNIVLNSAELIVGGINTFESTLTPPSPVTYFLTDDSNNFLLSADGSVFRTIQNDAPTINPLSISSPLRPAFETETNSYRSIITLYLQAMIDGRFGDDDKIYMVPASNASSVNRFTVSSDSIIVKMFYTVPQ